MIKRILFSCFFLLSFLSFAIAQWTKYSTPSNTYPQSILVVDGKIAVCDDYGMAISTDNGEHWERRSIKAPLRICQKEGNRLFALTGKVGSPDPQVLIQSNDLGQTWDTLATVSLYWVRQMAKVGNTVYFLYGSPENNTIQALDLNSGRTLNIDTFTYISSDFRYVYAMKSMGDKIFLATDWGLYRYSDGGNKIEKIYNEKTTMLSVRGDTLISLTQDNFIFSRDEGQTWTSIPHNYFFWPTNPKELYFVNGKPWMVASDDLNGCKELAIWELSASFTNGLRHLRLRDNICSNGFVAAPDSSFLFATDYYGIIKRKAGETNWYMSNTGLHYGNFEAYQQGDLMVGNGSISANTGQTWFSPIAAPNNNYLRSIVKKDGAYYATFDYSGLFKSTDLKHWQQLATWVPHINKIGDLLVTTTAWGAVQYSTDGQNWTNTNNSLQQAHFPPDQIQGDLIYMLRSDPVFGNKLTVQTSSDWAATWHSTGLDYVASNTEQIHDFAVSGADVCVQTSFSNGPGNQFYVSHDYGHHWKPLPKPAAQFNAALQVEPSNGLLFVGGEDQIWATANDGETWILLDMDTISGDFQKMFIAFDKLWVSTSEALWARELSKIPFEIYKGRVFHDQNANGLRDTTESGIANVLIKVTNRDWQVLSDSLGHFEIRAELVNDSIGIVPPVPYCNVVPQSYKADGALFDGYDFAVQTQPNVNDVQVTAVNAQIFRPGFETDVYVTLHNRGTVPLDRVQLGLPDFDDLSPIQLLSAEPPPSQILGDTLVWDTLAVPLFGKKDVVLHFRTNADAAFGETVTLRFTAHEQLDANPTDNVYTLFETLFGAYDPNDKRVEPDTLPPASLGDTQLKYTIRFQNTGNYPADFVTILDTLPQALDMSSLQFLSASHPLRWKIKDGRVLEFKFNPIFLPDSNSNEAASHGFVHFSVRAKSDLPLGYIIQNRAAIYFDYNPPIITNYSNMHVNIPTVGTINISRSDALNIRPNPAQETVFIEKQGAGNGQLWVFSADGRRLMGQNTNGKSIALPISALPSGQYWILWVADGKQYASKLIKG